MTNCYRDVRKCGPFGEVRSGSGNTKGKQKRKRGRRIRPPRNQGRMEFEKTRVSTFKVVTIRTETCPLKMAITSARAISVSFSRLNS